MTATDRVPTWGRLLRWMSLSRWTGDVVLARVRSSVLVLEALSPFAVKHPRRKPNTPIGYGSSNRFRMLVSSTRPPRGWRLTQSVLFCRIAA